MKKLLVAALIAGAAFATYAAPAAKTAPKADAKKVECTCQKDAKACAKDCKACAGKKDAKACPAKQAACAKDAKKACKK